MTQMTPSRHSGILRHSRGPALLAAVFLLMSCQRLAQPLQPPPQFAMQAPQPAPLSVQQDVAQNRAMRDPDTPATVEDFERYARTTRILFARGSAELSDAARATLDRQAEWLKRHSDVRAVLAGHADLLGPREHQFALGERRAAAMKFYFTVHGISGERLIVTSFGKERPVNESSDEVSQSQNRRGETILIGLPGAPRP